MAPEFDLTAVQAAHNRAVNALLGNIPKLKETEACEIVEAMVALIFETMKLYAEGGEDVTYDQ